MGIKFIYQVPDRDQRSDTFIYPGQPPQQQQPQTQVSLLYKVEFDPATFTEIQVYNVTAGASAPDGKGGTTTLPAAGGQLGSTGMYCSKMDVRRTNKSYILDASFTFTTPPSISTNTGKWNATVSSDGVESTENATRYSDGTLITNVNGDIFYDGLSKVFYDEQFTVSFMTDAVEATLLGSLRGKVNTVAITLGPINGLTRTFPINTLLLKNARWKTTYSDTTSSDPAKHKFEFSVEIALLYRNAKHPTTGAVIGWAPLLVNKGWRRFQSGSPVLDSRGNPLDLHGKVITQPIFLAASGDQLDASGGNVPAVYFPTTPNMVLDTADLTPALTGIQDSGPTSGGGGGGSGGTS